MKIQINIQACGNPLDCKLCLYRCSQGVFGIYPRVQREPGMPTRDWAIIPLFSSQCTACMECVSFCPQQAISVRRPSSWQKIRDTIALARVIVYTSGTAWEWK
ncbi:MAG: 4Fe-4S binding protein [Dehalococcoidia bacterium]|nr:4Fe-4S binding protein [Dehalococcoidia bacterium]